MKTCRVSKVHARFHETTKEPFTNTKTKKANHDAETNNLDDEKPKNRREQNFEDEANNMQLDKEDTQRSNFSSKYLSVTLSVKKYPDSLICFYPAAG